MRTSHEMTEAIRQKALALGFSAVGVTPAVSPGGVSKFQEWLDAGFAGEMTYLKTRRDAYRHPDSVLPGVRSVVMLALNYKSAGTPDTGSGHGRVSRYAFGEVDYHDWIHARLKLLKKSVLELDPNASLRGVVDTAPLLEREFAMLAGLGWVGKNTMLLNKQLGSLFFLSALLTDLELVYDDPHHAAHCGTCTACLNACPTDAFVEPYKLDATRCISYLTIELKNEIPRPLRNQIGDWVFGCDVCQDVCPWNNKAPQGQHPEFQPQDDRTPLALYPLFDMSDEGFRDRFRRSPLWRSKRRGILRNAAIVLGNSPELSHVPVLEKGLADSEALIRGTCAWALGEHVLFPETRPILERSHAVETDPDVLAEIEVALNRLTNSSNN